MFSVVTGCCSSFRGTSESTATDRLKKTVIADAALAVVFSIIAILGFSGALPLGVGIAFCVLAVTQLVGTIILRKCLSEKSSLSCSDSD